jgi:hypothetical protein
MFITNNFAVDYIISELYYDHEHIFNGKNRVCYMIMKFPFHYHITEITAIILYPVTYVVTISVILILSNKECYIL